MQRAGQRNVIDVVTGGFGERAGLAPARHAAVHEARVAHHAGLRADAEPLGDTGTEAFDEHVGVFGKAKDDFDAALAL